MSDYDVREIQGCIYPILKYFHDFCQKNNLEYYAIGGTLLGAVRHKGFIPWDDDIDIGMPRDDYDRMLEIFNLEKGSYVLDNFSMSKKSNIAFSKIYDPSSIAIEDTYLSFERGVWIDIFPLDGLPEKNSAEEFGLIKRFIVLFHVMCGNFSTHEMSFLKKNLYVLIFRIFGKNYFFKKICFKYINTLCRKNSFKDSEFVANIFGRWGVREIVPKKFFKKSIELDFNDMKLKVPFFYKEYLECIYGNYLEMPPLDKRVGHEFKFIKIK